MILSQTCQNALQASLHLAKNHEKGYIPIKNIAVETEISYHFLGKILQTLTKDGVLNSYKGPNGGVMLARQPSEISLFDVIKAIDGESINEYCMIGLKKCDPNGECLIHSDWGNICRNIVDILKKRMLSDLI